jgi:hypothetical protein
VQNNENWAQEESMVEDYEYRLLFKQFCNQPKVVA